MRERQPVTLVPQEELEELGRLSEEPTASDVAEENLGQELKDTEGMTVTVYACPGGPHKPNVFCFTQPWSNFMQMDDLRAYVQKHYARQFPLDSAGSIEFRGHFRKAGRLKYNILFSVSPAALDAAPTPAPSTSSGELRAMLDFMREESARRDRQLAEVMARLNTPPADPMTQIKNVMDVMGPYIKPAAPAGTGGLMEGYETFRQVRGMILDDLRDSGAVPGKAEPAPWWAELVREAAPVLGGIVAGLKERANRPAQPAGDVRIVADPHALAHNPPAAPEAPAVDTITDPKVKIAVETLAGFAPQLKQLNGAALITPADKAAIMVLNATPEQHYPVLVGLSSAENREAALTAIVHHVPEAVNNRAWWGTFLDTVHADLTAPDEPGDNLAGA